MLIIAWSEATTCDHRLHTTKHQAQEDVLRQNAGPSPKRCAACGTDLHQALNSKAGTAAAPFGSAWLIMMGADLSCT